MVAVLHNWKEPVVRYAPSRGHPGFLKASTRYYHSLGHHFVHQDHMVLLSSTKLLINNVDRVNRWFWGSPMGNVWLLQPWWRDTRLRALLQQLQLYRCFDWCQACRRRNYHWEWLPSTCQGSYFGLLSPIPPNSSYLLGQDWTKHKSYFVHQSWQSYWHQLFQRGLLFGPFWYSQGKGSGIIGGYCQRKEYIPYLRRAIQRVCVRRKASIVIVVHGRHSWARYLAGYRVKEMGLVWRPCGIISQLEQGAYRSDVETGNGTSLGWYASSRFAINIEQDWSINQSLLPCPMYQQATLRE